MCGQRGGSAVEFALFSVVLVPLLIGTVGIGTLLMWTQESIQITRDAGHMYARGVDFSMEGNQAMLAKIGTDLGMATSGGKGVAILSTLTYIGRYQCKALGLADSSTPPNPTAACTNYGHWVFSHRVKIGNTALPNSKFGSPDSSLVNAETGYITRSDYTIRSGARCDSFSLLPKPKEDGTDRFQAGQFAYLVETYFSTPAVFASMTGRTAYAHAMF